MHWIFLGAPEVHIWHFLEYHAVLSCDPLALILVLWETSTKVVQMLTMTAMYVNGGGNQRYARWNRQDSLEDYTRTEGYEQDGEGKQRKLTPFEKLTHDMSHEEKTVKEITLGKRIGFYRLRGEIGSGNFSQVKLGIHVLTKGNFLY